MTLDPLDLRLLDGWQRGLPLVPRPFAAIGGALWLSECTVLARLVRLAESGAISRVGATVRPNTVGASTLAAVAAPEGRVEEVARSIGAEPGVNHSYLREDGWNLWFVMTGPDRAHVTDGLARIAAATGLEVLDLPLVRPFNIDLGFRLAGAAHLPPAPAEADLSALRPGDRAILAALSRGLALVAEPYAALARGLDRPEAEVIARIAALAEAGIISRLGVIVRHRRLGWRANAMVVWQVPEAEADAAGEALAAQPGVTLCYRRRPDPRWPYNLYCMIHARSRDEANATLERAAKATGLGALERRVLFSTRCFRQRGALVLPGKEEAA
ncbi:MAG TPA: Lrp/AsnC family transcriptional regulator [Thermohalobaculum sp.]|nr:Lrp/AsnC family transcriptional regulator [Thermohalobaculum sp.]